MTLTSVHGDPLLVSAHWTGHVASNPMLQYSTSLPLFLLYLHLFVSRCPYLYLYGSLYICPFSGDAVMSVSWTLVDAPPKDRDVFGSL